MRFSIIYTMESINSLINMVQSGASEMQYSDLNSTSGNSTQQFQELLQVMMFSSHLNENNAGNTGESSSLFGSDMFMMPLMMNLMEQLMEMQLGGSSGVSSPLEIAGQIQINQFEAEMQLGGDGINANCGPASLAMALRSFGSVPVSEAMNGSLVDFARRLMIEDESRDGVGSQGLRIEWEHNAYTSLSEIAHGAEQAGLQTRRITSTGSSIVRSVQSGARVIVSGTFRNKEPLPWTGDTERDYYRAPGGAKEHFVLVSGYDERTGKLIVNDPARHSPIAVYPHQLEAFMEGNEGALVLYR